jgi:hypothetical protein
VSGLGDTNARERVVTKNCIVINDLGAVKNGRARLTWRNIPAIMRVYVLEVQSLAFGPSKGTIMTEPTPQTTVAPAASPDKGLLARAAGIIFSPRATFALLAARPRWFGMLALLVTISAVMLGGFLFTSVGQQAFLDAMEQRGSGAQQIEAMSRFVGYLWIAYGLGTLIVTPLMLLAFAGILLAVFTLLGGGASFKQVFAVVVHSGVVSVLGQLIIFPLNYATGTMRASTNLGVLFPMLDERSFLALMFGTIDLFWVWLVMVLSIGLAVVYKRRTGPIAVAFFVLYALIAVGYAAWFAARS